MGGVVNHSSNLPQPVALSSVEAEYNEACITLMATNHLTMILMELENMAERKMPPIVVYLDSKSTIVMGASYKDTRHIMRRYHYVRNEIAARILRLSGLAPNTRWPIVKLNSSPDRNIKCWQN